MREELKVKYMDKHGVWQYIGGWCDAQHLQELIDSSPNTSKSYAGRLREVQVGLGGCCHYVRQRRFGICIAMADLDFKGIEC